MDRKIKRIVFGAINILEKGTIIAGGFVCISLILLGIVVTYGVFTRVILNDPSPWTDQVSIYLLWATTFFGAAYAMSKNSHINVDVFISRLSENNRLKLELITLLISLTFTGALFYSGILLVEESYLYDQRDNTLLRMKLFVPQSFIPLGSFFLSISILEKLLINIAQLRWPNDIKKRDVFIEEEKLNINREEVI